MSGCPAVNQAGQDLLMLADTCVQEPSREGEKLQVAEEQNMKRSPTTPRTMPHQTSITLSPSLELTSARASSMAFLASSKLTLCSCVTCTALSPWITRCLSVAIP